ncbi:uncharacterized protein EV420DRAFT_421314 [Desarmillaria tabescens]|uniref:Uncharacterized protein n=1 Tax=Armillaria tabescens TaxID=1929756 RepID=A0AA39J277_ARMTA|nr:uncharacterized protein EV420DRAFT_421314 [Desarmillaria tabescens]KAK0434174.1 hypothetical protein EV420DRAFT_421314 [Desarmillaria tabescens]
MMVADVVSPAVFEAMASVVQPHPPSIPPNGTRSLSNKQILKACSLPVIMSVLSAIGVVFNRVFKLSHGRHSASSSLSTVLRSTISGSSSRTLFLALILAVTVALTLGLLVVQSLLLSANSSTTFDVLRIVLFAHVGMAGIYVIVSALWDTLERRVANEERGIGQGEVAAEEDTLGGDDGEQDIGSLPVTNLQALSTTAYMSARSTNGEPASEIPEAQVTSSTGNTPSNQSVATVPEQNGASLMPLVNRARGMRFRIPSNLPFPRRRPWTTYPRIYIHQ